MVATPSPHSDFPVTRGLIATLPTWVNQLASLLPRPVPVPAQPRGFRWAYSDETAEVVQIAKAVRMVSGIAAAMHLADLGFTVECGTVLRTVSDFASEITFLAEGHLTGRMNPDQERFVKDFFKPMPTTPEALEKWRREGYVGRGPIQKAHQRLVEKTTKSVGVFKDVQGLLTKAYDDYVHGSYLTAMSLFTGSTYRFMLGGHESPHHRCMMKVSVAGKLTEVLGTLGLMAVSRKQVPLVMTIRQAMHDLHASNEDSGDDCPDE